MTSTRQTCLTALALALLAAGASSALAGEARSRRRTPDPYEELTLPAGEVSAAVEPWRPDIRACWLQHATPRVRADGHLRIEVIIDPAGMVWTHQVSYAGRKSGALGRCLGKVIAQLRFPMRRGYTMAAVPFIFRASVGRGAEPIMSCHSPRGCRRRPAP